ncbi:Glycosyltransferase [Melia azedarach]|uniref:Glycosyltransferase n=1 Tax=Melia azedarach TaxID=155640 RepID=A0ACC1XIH2_MELAZ|nr:Glycosyltransferase [Melia azedarach]
MSSSATEEIWIVPFFGQGHLFPSMELCKQIASRNYKSNFIVSSHLSNSIPSSLYQYSLVEITEIPSSPPAPPPRPQPRPQPGSDPPQHQHVMHSQMAQGFENLLSKRVPVCVVIDVMMGWTADVFKKFQVPIVAFFTSGACSAALEYAMWQAHLDPEDIKPGEIRSLPGLPENLGLSRSDIQGRPHPHNHHGGPPPPHSPPPGAPGPKKLGPPTPGDQPMWIAETEGSIALMINTCDDLEQPFIKYLANQLGKPVWGVGPLLPEQFYKSAAAASSSAGSVLVHDREIRTNRRRSNVTEEEVIQWLDSKAPGSVLYVSFGTEVGPSLEEYSELAKALEATKAAFIWVIPEGAGRSGPPPPAPPPPHLTGAGSELPEGYCPDGMDNKVGKRGLIIRGWAPQLLILSHPSTGGILSHCGWNSTLEAIGCGVPVLGWPIRGDQHYNAKLVINHLKVGCMVCNDDDVSKSIRMDDILNGIGRLMGNGDGRKEMKKRADMLRTIFDHGFPATSVASLDAFIHLIHQKQSV